MNTQETAIEFKVATPETSEKLCHTSDFESKFCGSKLWWVTDLDNELWLCYNTDLGYVSILHTQTILDVHKEFPAPQFDEIMPLLPEKMSIGNRVYEFEMTHEWIGYINKDVEYGESLGSSIRSHHYAEAAALLYLKTLELKIA